MGIISWIVVGLIAGVLVRVLLRARPEDMGASYLNQPMEIPEPWPTPRQPAEEISSPEG